MHYANGRPAKNGDTVLQITHQIAIGVLYNATHGNDYCNGMLAPIPGGQHTMACLADCVHFDDVLAALNLDPKKSMREQLANIRNSLILPPDQIVASVGTSVGT